MEYYFQEIAWETANNQNAAAKTTRPFTTTQSIDCKPSDFRYSTKKSIKRTRNQEFNNWLQVD